MDAPYSLSTTRTWRSSSEKAPPPIRVFRGRVLSSTARFVGQLLILVAAVLRASTMTTSRTQLGLKILRHLPPSPARRSCVWGAYVGLIITID